MSQALYVETKNMSKLVHDCELSQLEVFDVVRLGSEEFVRINAQMDHSMRRSIVLVRRAEREVESACTLGVISE